jgi:hypothetical protein
MKSWIASWSCFNSFRLKLCLVSNPALMVSLFGEMRRILSIDSFDYSLMRVLCLLGELLAPFPKALKVCFGFSGTVILSKNTLACS